MGADGRRGVLFPLDVATQNFCFQLEVEEQHQPVGRVELVYFHERLDQFVRVLIDFLGVIAFQPARVDSREGNPPGVLHGFVPKNGVDELLAGHA